MSSVNTKGKTRRKRKSKNVNEVKVKVFRIEGVMKLKYGWQKFSLERRGISKEDVIERVFSELGSRHKLSRRHIKITLIREVREEEITDPYIAKISSMEKILVYKIRKRKIPPVEIQ